MRKIYVLFVILMLLFFLQGCIFKNQPPIIESMSPSNGEKVNPDEVTFKWSAKDAEGGVLHYNFYLFSNGNIIKKEENLAGNNYVVKNLENLKQYEWWLEVVDEKGEKVKKIAQFETYKPNNKPIKSFLIYPNNNDNSVYPYNIKFQWNKSLDFDGDMVYYDLYLGESTPLITPIATNLIKTEYTISNLALNKTYYWEIVSHDSNGASTTSEIWTFKTVSNTPPIIDFPQKDFVVKENEEFELDLSNFVSDMEDDYFEYSIVTNNGASIQGSKYIFKPRYDFVKHSNSTRKIQEQIVVSDTKDNSSGFLNIIVKDVNQEPEKPKILYPLNNSIVPKDFVLKWDCSDLDGDDLKYDIYLGNYSGNYTKIATNITSKEYMLNLSYDTDYYLKIVAKDEYGGIRASDEIYFKTKKEPGKFQWEEEISGVKNIFAYNHRLIVVNENKIYRLNTNGLENYSIEINNIRSNSIIFGNMMFVPTNGGILKVIDLDKFETINTINVSDDIVGITANKDYKNRKYLYIITENGSVYTYSLENYSLYWNKNYNIIPSGPALIIENGYLVISGNYENVGKIILTKPKGKIYKEITFPQKITTLISNDENYNIYFATENKIYSYTKEGDKNWELNLSENVENEIIYDGENLYAAGKNKIFKIDKKGNLINTSVLNDIYSKTLLITENKNLIVVSNDSVIQNENKIILKNFGEIKTDILLNDGLIYFASNDKLYSVSLEDKNILNVFWPVFGKNIYKNRNSYIRNNTEPEKPELTYPQNQSIEIPKHILLTWECEDPEDDDLTYKIYLGEDDNLNLITTTNATSYEINLENGKRYYWKVIANDGELESESSIYSFNTIPAPAEEKFKIKVEGSTIYSPAISDENIIYFSTSSGSVYAYNSSGEKLWKYNTDGFVKSSVVLNPLNQVIIGNENGELYIINSDGTLSDKINLDGAIDYPVSLGSNGEIYVITSIGTIYKFGAYGNEIWKKELKGNPTSNIVIDKESNIYFAMNNYLYGLDLNGNVKFKKGFSKAISSRLSMDGNENVYFATGENKIYSINKYGRIIFDKYIGEEIRGSILIDNDNSIIFETVEGNLYKYYYLSDYMEKIELKDIPYSLILMENAKYITTKNKFIVYNGELEWYTLYNKIKYSPNIDANGVIIFGTTDGFLYGIYGEARNLRDTSWPIYLGDKKHTGNINKNITMPSNRPPLKPYNPYPQDKGEIALSTVTLSWESSDPDGDAVYYDVYFGNNLNQELKAQKLTKKEYKISNLKPGTYYWYIKAHDSYGNISRSDLWSFTVKEVIGENNPPLKPTLLEPVNNSENVPINASLKWSCSDPDGDSLTYDIYIEKEPILSTPKEIGYDGTSYSIILEPGETYYWKIVAKDGKGGETSSDVYSFNTASVINNPPSKPILLSPANNSIDVEPDITLRWSANDPDGDALTYDIYLDKTQNLNTPYKTNVKNTSLAVSGLELGVTYYWKVVAKDGKGGESTSDIYSFTIKESIGPLTPKLYFKDATIQSGSQGDLIIHGQKLENVQAFDIEISYDKTKLTVSQNNIQAIGELQGRSLIININNGKIKVTTLSFSPFNINNSDILKITFTAIGSSGNTEIKFTSNTKIVDSSGNELNVDISDVGIITIQ
ncbi:cohesin domain-containing protein [Marinitoga aeolica]|uniref:PQQ-binding-like beta-propeller repeat protein n=1 Tax=Marinitoga aeolica TaxID=2809031 RepID=A0ABY8PSJ3_9BACT|nr:cohesin domain-containing protein [Marinitoga aeolica]WGS65606.1 PQQ-binding-like beta-propeller repeat protein [Marinitoga aeolica]